MTAHWGVPDPAAVEGSDAEKAKAFRDVLLTLERRINLFTSLPMAASISSPWPAGSPRSARLSHGRAV